MKLKTILALLLLFGLKNACAESSIEPAIKPLSIGETIELHSNTLNEKRKLNIYLPQSYSEKTDKRYPVIYVLDGGLNQDFLHIVGLVQFNSMPWLDFMPESIVVGVANVDRKSDFTSPSLDQRDQKKFPTSGSSAKFINFLLSEVQPAIDERYRVNQTKTLVGQSLGGLLATQILFQQPQAFNNYLIVSPSLWWNQERLLAQNITPTKEKIKVFIAVANEGTTMVRLAISLADKLRQSYKSSDIAEYAYFDQLNHGDTLHLAAYKGLQVLFAKEDSK